MDNRYHQREKFIKIIEVQPQRATYTYSTRQWRTREHQILKSSGFITENHNGDTLVPDSLMSFSVVVEIIVSVIEDIQDTPEAKL